MSSRSKLAFGCVTSLVVVSLGIPFESRLATAQSESIRGAPPDKAAQIWPHDYNDPLVLTEQETEDSYAIYSRLLKDELKEWHLKRYAVEEWTGDMRGTPSDTLCLQPEKEKAALYQDEFHDFLTKNRSRHQLLYRLDLVDYLLLSPEQSHHLSGLFASVPDPRWSDDDRKLYDDINVIFTVSEVGFNHDHSRALVYIGHICGSLCGGGTYHLLIRRDGRWQNDPDYKGTWCQWVS